MQPLECRRPTYGLAYLLLINLLANFVLLLIYLQNLSSVQGKPVYELIEIIDNSTLAPSPSISLLATNSSNISDARHTAFQQRFSPRRPTPSKANEMHMLHPTFHDISSEAGSLLCSDGEYESDEVQGLLGEWLEDTFLLQLKVIFLGARYSCADFAREQDVLGHETLPNVWTSLIHHVMRHSGTQEAADSYQFFALQPGTALVTELHNTLNCNFVPAYCRALKNVGEKIGVNRRALAAFAPSVARLYRTNLYTHQKELRNGEINKTFTFSNNTALFAKHHLILADPALDAQVNAWVDFQVSALTSTEMSCHDLIQNYSNYARLAQNETELVQLEAIGPLWMDWPGENELERQAHINWCRLLKTFTSKAPMNISVQAMRKSSPQLITIISEDRQIRTRTRFTVMTLILLGIAMLGILSFIAFKAIGLYVVHRVDQFVQLRRQSIQELRSFIHHADTSFRRRESANADAARGNRLPAELPMAETKSL